MQRSCPNVQINTFIRKQRAEPLRHTLHFYNIIILVGSLNCHDGVIRLGLEVSCRERDKDCPVGYNYAMVQRQAHAKVNLTLDVLFLREDGFHEIESVFQTVGLMDDVRLQLESENKLTCEGWNVPLDESNSCLQAVKLFQAEASWPLGVHIHLVKRIPLQAGLGGGSSDAAAVLTGLAELALKCGIEPPPLQPIAAQIGSDVPFFLQGGRAIVSGRGEIVEPFEPLPRFCGVLAMPAGTGVSTAWAYRHLKRPSRDEWDKPETRTGKLVSALQGGNVTGAHSLSGYLANDFEEIVLQELEPLRILRRKMTELEALRVLLCGSGAAQFALCEEEETARTMAETLQAEGYWACPVWST